MRASSVVNCQSALTWRLLRLSCQAATSLDERRLVGNAAVSTLRGKHGEFGLGHVEPAAVLWRVMPFEPLAQASRFGGREGRVERRRRVRREIVLHQHDLRGGGEMRIGQILEHVGVIDGGVTVGDFHAPPSFQRREHHEQIGDAVTFVFVIVTRLASGRGGNGRARLDDHLLGGLVETNHRALRIMRPSDRLPARLPCWRRSPRWLAARSPIAV